MVFFEKILISTFSILTHLTQKKRNIDVKEKEEKKGEH